MNWKKIEGSTRELGKPRDWDDTKGECGSLPIRDVAIDGVHRMESAWLPTPDELRALNEGKSVILSVWGTGHPPVALYVE